MQKQSHAQVSFPLESWQPEVLGIDGASLLNPWTGGLNFCQFSPIDLDQDGRDDMIVFDRSGNRVMPFLADNSDGFSWIFAPEYAEFFPPVEVLCLLKDYDGDGQPDLISYKDVGPVVYRNTRKAGSDLGFEPYNNLSNLPTEFDGSPATLLMTGTDIPALEDVDQDGDLDILLFDGGGSFLQWHANLSQDLYGHSDSLIFRLESPCWGHFAESSGDNKVILDTCFEGLSGGGSSRHIGSTSTLFDPDQDGDFDLLLGDISFQTLTYLENDGSLPDGRISDQNTWPSADDQARVEIFPVGFELQLDEDDLADIVMSPSGRNISENNLGIKRYRNTGALDSESYVLEESGFLQNSTIDLGEGCSLTHADIDGDGDQDILAGNFGYFLAGGDYLPRISWIENLGIDSDSMPHFQIRDLNFIALDPLDEIKNGVRCAFGDLDDDLDLDAIVIFADGSTHYFENQGDAQNPEFVLLEEDFQEINVGKFVHPQLLDFDRDGDLDLILGERNGNLNFMRNIGSASNPVFSLEDNLWGDVDVSGGLLGVGFSTPYVFEEAGRWFVLVGSEKANIYLYSGLENATFQLEDSLFAGGITGERSSPIFVDFNQDGYRDLFTGLYGGGMLAWKGLKPDLGSIAGNPDSWQIIPSLNDGSFSVQIGTDHPGGTFLLYDAKGALLEQLLLESGSINLQYALSSGVYILQGPFGESHRFVVHPRP
jgi:hypothetical protein